MQAIHQWIRQWIIKIYKFFTLNRDEYPYHKSAEINEIKKPLQMYKLMKQKYYVCTQLFKLSVFQFLLVTCRAEIRYANLLSSRDP